MFSFTTPDLSTNLSRCCETNGSLHAGTTHVSTKPWTRWDSAALRLLGRDIAQGSAPPFRSPNWENGWHESPALITAAWLHLDHTPAITWGQPASPITYSHPPWTLWKVTIRALESTATMVCTPTAWAPCVGPSNPQQASTSLKKSSQVCSEWNNTLVPSSTFSNGIENCCTRTKSNRVSTSGTPSKRPVNTIPVPSRTEDQEAHKHRIRDHHDHSRELPPASTSARSMTVHGTTRWTERSTICRARPHLLVGVEPTADPNHQPGILLTNDPVSRNMPDPSPAQAVLKSCQPRILAVAVVNFMGKIFLHGKWYHFGGIPMIHF